MEMGESAQFPEDSAKLGEAIFGDSRADLHRVAKKWSPTKPRLRTFSNNASVTYLQNLARPVSTGATFIAALCCY
jgi:hypothetical protein